MAESSNPVTPNAFSGAPTEVQEELFVKAYCEHEKMLLTRSLSKVGDKDLAQDLVQETFLKTWSYLVRKGEVSSMKSFLFHVLNGLIIDEYRKKKPLSLDVLAESGFEVGVNNLERMINITDGKTALRLITLLPEKYQVVVTLRYLEELTLEEIAEKTNQSKNTVSVQLHRGIEKLTILYLSDEPKNC
jgi:RNA polymerase sigma-70 factor (ECF subfamily)